MPYVLRDEQGALSGLTQWPIQESQEYLPDDHPEVTAFNLPQQSPNWNGLLNSFLAPGNPLYESVLGKVAQSGFVVQNRWSNLCQVISNPTLRRTEGLAFAVQQLGAGLSGAGYPLSTAEVEAWNQLMDDLAFPASCKI